MVESSEQRTEYFSSGNASICPRGKSLLVENLSKGFDLYDLPRSSPSYTFQTPTKKRCVKDGVFAEESTAVICGSDHGRVYVFSTASPDPVQVIKQGSGKVEIQAVAVSSSILFDFTKH